MQHLDTRLDTRRLSEVGCQLTLYKSARSVCAMSRLVARIVLAVLCKQRVVQQPKDKLDVDNLLVHQTFVATLTVWRHVVLQPTFVSGLHHCNTYITLTQSSNMFFPHPSSRQHLQWCLVEDTACPHHRRYHPSKSSLHLLGGSAVTRPHHCQLQWLSSVSRPHHCSRSGLRAISLWGGHQFYHNVAPSFV